MISRAELEALAVRVETEEPSERLDFDVLEAITPPGVSWTYRPFTSSLDAAASLMPEGWRVGDLEQTGPSGKWRCILWTGVGADKIARSTAPTEPRARTAAALRAIAQEANHD